MAQNSEFIPVHPRIGQHAKILSLADRVGFTPIETWPRVFQIWAWAFDNSSAGDVTELLERGLKFGITEALLSLPKKKAREFIEAMIEVRLLEKTESGQIEIHHWNDHGCGAFLQEREKTREYWRKKKQEQRDAERKSPEGLPPGHPEGLPPGGQPGVPVKLNEPNPNEPKSGKEKEAPRPLSEDGKDDPPKCPTDKLIELYNQTCAPAGLRRQGPVAKKNGSQLRMWIDAEWRRNPDIESWENRFKEAASDKQLIQEKADLAMILKMEYERGTPG